MREKFIKFMEGRYGVDAFALRYTDLLFAVWTSLKSNSKILTCTARFTAVSAGN